MSNASVLFVAYLHYFKSGQAYGVFTKVYLNYPFSYLVAKMGLGHRHGDTYLYRICVSK